ncbi:MAG: succinate dehydrogenase assembly factor 2 [Xanthomonadales bacterium]|nr:succinate dehydrogenase assembly factor 2 [Xanthomonadales bacterium]
METTQRVKRLKWLCRRGMKELDVLLETFIAGFERQLDAGAWPEFEALLQTEDDRIWDWVQAPGSPDAAGFHQLLATIRHGTASQH